MSFLSLSYSEHEIDNLNINAVVLDQHPASVLIGTISMRSQNQIQFRRIKELKHGSARTEWLSEVPGPAQDEFNLASAHTVNLSLAPF
jgi:hypothetical protein